MHHAISVRDGPSGRRGFSVWEMPASLTIHQFVVRVGEFGGYAVLETCEPADLQYLTTAFAAFALTVEPVMDVMDAVAAESRAIEWRDGQRRSHP